MKLLHIDSSISGDNSVSRKLSRALTNRLIAANPGAEITYRDVALDPLPHLTFDKIAGMGIGPDADASGAAMDEFLAADTIVIGVPMYNFTVPSQLKAWVDRILVAGKTFRYSETGPVGLASGKRVILALSRGNFYGAESPNVEAELAERYLRTIFGFIGITDVETVVAEGIAISDDQRAKAINDADEAVLALAA